jgi:hypothetical protein
MKKFAKFLLLAQAASDAGKGYIQPSKNANKAVSKGYGLKDLYISQAIAEAKKHKSRVKVSRDFDCDLGMTIVYFDIEGYGQVSFHTFEKFNKLPNNGAWDGIKGGSIATCRRLAKRYGLQEYK